MKIRDNFISSYFRKRKINLWMLFFLLVYIVLVIKLITIQKIDNNILFGTYSILVSAYILSRFGLAYFYEHEESSFDPNYEPTISFAVPSKNEGENIRETILKIANTDYPKSKFDVMAINDGSTDNTLHEMITAKEIAASHGVRVRVFDWKVNRGKRDGMAECVKQSTHD